MKHDSSPSPAICRIYYQAFCLLLYRLYLNRNGYTSFHFMHTPRNHPIHLYLPQMSLFLIFLHRRRSILVCGVIFYLSVFLLQHHFRGSLFLIFLHRRRSILVCGVIFYLSVFLLQHHFRGETDMLGRHFILY